MAVPPLKYKRKVKPSKVLPPDLIRGFYEKDVETLKEVSRWLDKNGLTILFTLEEAYGDERVYLDNDGYIYIGTDKIPKKDWLKKCLHRHSPELLIQATQEKWVSKKMFSVLKNLSDVV